MLDRTLKPIFQSDTPKFTEYGRWVFSTLAWEIARYSEFRIDLEGHTEHGHPPMREDYDTWELTADRANAARRALVQSGVVADQIRKVSGFGDTRPMRNILPTDEVNRRVTVLLRVQSDNPNQS